MVEAKKTAQPKEADEVEKEETKPVEKVKLSGFYWKKDIDGTKEKIVITSEGASVKDALDAFDYPRGLNALFTLTVQKGNIRYERALAQHKAQAILGDKNIYEFGRVFRPL